MRKLIAGWAGVAGLLMLFRLSAGESIDNLRTKGNAGEVRAMLQLGYNYRDGVGGVAKDEREAVAWFRRAADLDSAEAYDNLGYFYCQGRGVPMNLVIASGYFRAAAEKGWAWGQYDLGMDCFYGRGMERDYAQAVMWWERAAASGHQRAAFMLGYCLMNAYGVRQDETRAVTCLESAAQKGDADAWWVLGEYYSRQAGGFDLEKARNCWEKARQNVDYKLLLNSVEWRRVQWRLANVSF